MRMMLHANIIRYYLRNFLSLSSVIRLIKILKAPIKKILTTKASAAK